MRILYISLLMLSTACNFTGRGIQKKKDKKDPPAATPADPAPTGDEANKDLPAGVLAQFKADYKLEPVDVVIVMEDNPVFGAQTQKINYAAEALAARMAFTSLDFRLTIVGVGAGANGTQAAARTGDGEGTFLASTTKDLRTKVVGRLTKPATTSSEVLSSEIFYTEVSDYFASGELRTALRPDAWLSVLVIQGFNEGNTAQLKAALESAHPARYSLSALSVFDGDKDLFPDCSAQAAQNKDLAEAVDTTHGVRASLCEQSYASYFSDWLVDASGTRFFQTLIAKDLDATKMRVEAGGSFISNWSYDKATGALTLPRVIALGTDVVVRTSETASGTPATATDPTQPTAPTITPEQKKFNDEINPLLTKYCGACHGAGGGYTQYVGNLSLVKQRKANLLDRLQRPEGTVGRMPTAGNVDAAELQTLLAYLTAL